MIRFYFVIHWNQLAVAKRNFIFSLIEFDLNKHLKIKLYIIVQLFFIILFCNDIIFLVRVYKFPGYDFSDI